MAKFDSVCVYCCRMPVDPAWRPFCSQRCKLADLGRWLMEDYRVPDEPIDTADDPDSGGDK